MHRDRVGELLAARGRRRRGGRRPGGRRPARPPPARPRSRLGGGRARADAAPGAGRRRRGGGRGLRDLPRRAAARARHGALGGDARAGRRAPRGAGRRGAPAPRRLPCRGRCPASSAGRSWAAREQLAALRAAWARAGAGAAAVVVLAGEAGSGKTRLLAELAGEARDAGATRARGPLRGRRRGAVRALHRGAAPVRRGDDPDALPEWVTAELARLLPELDAGPGSPGGDAAAARHRLFEAVAAAVGHAARSRPGAAGRRGPALGGRPPTLQLLGPRRPQRRVGAAARARLAARRGRRGGPALRALLGDLQRERQPRASRPRRRCPRTRPASWRPVWLGGPPPPALAAAVHGRTGGNPLFVEELVRHLVESYPGQPAEALVAAAEREVPHGVRAVIDRRWPASARTSARR